MVTTVAATIRGFLVPYARHFRAAGWRVEAAAQGVRGDEALQNEFDALHELSLTRSIKDVRGMRSGYRDLRALLRSGADIVHVHTPIAGFVTRAAAATIPARERPAVVYTAHGFHFHRDGHPLANALFIAAERLAGRWTDRLVVINHEDRAAAHRWRIVSDDRLVEMPGIGLDTSWYRADAVDPSGAAQVRAEAGIPADAPMFVLIAELNRNKRPLDAIEALARMTHTDAHLLLLGDGPLREAVLPAARERGIDGRVHLAGVVKDVRPYLLGANGLLLTSRREGLPRSIMEALSMGVPVVSSSARGSTQLVLPDAGSVVETGDVSALASAMDALIADPVGAAQMGRHGRDRMVSSYDEGIVIGAHERLYQELRAGHPPRP
jgi:glycosyltransferase involved in cell wall biosynthesis